MFPRKLVVVLFLLLPSCLIAATPRAEMYDARISERVSGDALLHLARRVIAAENDRLTSIEQSTVSAEAPAAIRLALETQSATLDARRAALAAHGLAYTNAQSEVSLVRVERSFRNALIRVHERTTLAIKSDAEGAPLETVLEREHDIECAQTGAGWIAVADTVQDDASLAGEPGISAEPPVELPNIVVDDSVMHAEPSGSGNPRIAALAVTYDRSAVAWYARRWVGQQDSMSTVGYNTDYIAYPGDDCTNFVSQSLAWGRFPQVKGFYWLSSSWWYDKWAWPRKNSNAWSVANTFKDFLATSGRATLMTSVRDLQVGDVLQADFQNDGWVDHTTVVTGRDSNGNIWLTYHSYNKKDISFWDFDAQNRSRNAAVKYYRWHLANSF